MFIVQDLSFREEGLGFGKKGLKFTGLQRRALRVSCARPPHIVRKPRVEVLSDPRAVCLSQGVIVP